MLLEYSCLYLASAGITGSHHFFKPWLHITKYWLKIPCPKWKFIWKIQGEWWVGLRSCGSRKSESVRISSTSCVSIFDPHLPFDSQRGLISLLYIKKASQRKRLMSSGWVPHTHTWNNQLWPKGQDPQSGILHLKVMSRIDLWRGFWAAK